MALTSAKQVKAQIGKLRKDLNTAVKSAEKQRKAAQDTLGGLVNRAKQLLSSLGNSRIVQLLEGKKASPAQRMVKQVKSAAKTAQKRASKSVKQAQKTVRKVEKKVEKRAQKAVKDVKKTVVQARKTVKASLPRMSGNGSRPFLKKEGVLSRAAMATSKAKAAVTPSPSPTPAPQPVIAPATSAPMTLL